MKVRKEQAIYGERIKEAREICGFQQTTLAGLVNVKRQAISAFEKNKIKPSTDTLFAIAASTRFPISFFLNDRPRGDSLRTAPISFRKLKIATKTTGLQAAQYENLLADIYYYLNYYIDFHSANISYNKNINYRSLKLEDIEDIATDVRRSWDLGDGPIPDMTRLLENNGIMISEIDLPYTLDAISTWRHNRPFILLSDFSSSGSRRRFNLGHELGHLILHQMVTKEEFDDPELLKKLEKQAHRFAGAFLFPATSLKNEYFSNSMTALKILKSRWKISIQAIAMRLYDLKLINEHQKKYIIMNIRDRKNEVLDDLIPKEKPTLIKRAFEMLLENHVLTLQNTVDDLKMSEKIFTMLTGIEVKKQMSINDKIIPFAIRKANINL